MPSRAALSSNALRAIRREPYVCPTCLLRSGAKKNPSKPASRSHSIAFRPIRSPARTHQESIRRLNPRRYISNESLASSTAINAPSPVPLHLRDLHQRLLLLQDKANSYVDLSRLRLALRSLESTDPVIRVALLGLGKNGVKAARKLARVLLADELGAEEDWERELLAASDGRSTVLKYGEPGDDTGVQPSTAPLVHEVKIPYARLKRWNLEILISGLNAAGFTSSNSADGAKELEESILVPPVTIPNSTSGRVGFVRYPVHRAMIVADGISGAVEFGRLPATLVDGTLINAALSLSMRTDAGKTFDHDTHANAISIDLANEALDLFRASNSNGAIYSELWQASQVSAVTNWLSAASEPKNGVDGLKPAVEETLTSVLARADSVISSSASAAETSSTALTVSDAKRSLLQSAITTWSGEAHRDLQLNLALALVSPSWRRTTWWRLFWRIDEVSISTGDVLQRGWLVEAEQSLAFLSGRVLEAGLASAQELKAESTSSQTGPGALLDEDTKDAVDTYKTSKLEGAPLLKYGTAAELTQLPPILARVKTETGLDAMFDPPWPQTIHLARQQMLHQTVPALHRKAQSLLLASLSTIGASTALGAWLWVASGGVALYEAGALSAFGLAWALRRLQNLWSRERDGFASAAREDGRRVLAEVEGRMKRLVSEGGRPRVHDQDLGEWEEARSAVAACEAALARVAEAGGRGGR